MYVFLSWLTRLKRKLCFLSASKCIYKYIQFHYSTLAAYLNLCHKSPIDISTSIQMSWRYKTSNNSFECRAAKLILHKYKVFILTHSNLKITHKITQILSNISVKLTNQNMQSPYIMRYIMCWFVMNKHHNFYVVIS